MSNLEKYVLQMDIYKSCVERINSPVVEEVHRRASEILAALNLPDENIPIGAERKVSKMRNLK